MACRERARDGPVIPQAAPTPIALSVKDHAIRLLVSDEKLEKRRAERKFEKRSAPRGYDLLYCDHVLQADECCDFDFPRNPGEAITR